MHHKEALLIACIQFMDAKNVLQIILCHQSDGLAIILIFSQGIGMVGLPEVAFTIKEKRTEIIIHRILEPLVQPMEFPRLHIQFEGSISRSTYQEMMLAIFYQAIDSHLLIFLFQYDALESIGSIRILVETAIGSYKESFLVIRINIHDFIVLNGGGISRIAEIGTETVSIKTIQPILGTHPDKPVLILHDFTDHATRQVVGCIKSSRVSMREACQHLHEAKNSKE